MASDQFSIEFHGQGPENGSGPSLPTESSSGEKTSPENETTVETSSEKPGVGFSEKDSSSSDEAIHGATSKHSNKSKTSPKTPSEDLVSAPEKTSKDKANLILKKTAKKTEKKSVAGEKAGEKAGNKAVKKEGNKKEIKKKVGKKTPTAKTTKKTTKKDSSHPSSKNHPSSKRKKSAASNTQSTDEAFDREKTRSEAKMFNHDYIEMLEPVARSLRLYHRHDVNGLDHVPRRGKAIIVVNHSLATYDIALLIHAIYMRTGRIVRPLVDRLFYKIPFVGELMNALGCSSGNKQNASALLKDRQLVLVAPGGMREALRPSSEKYQTKWDSRKGFARMSLETQTPIILAVCPKADDLYKVYPSSITKWMYKNLKIPIFFARGLGPTPIPRPVKLTHFLSTPIRPPRKTKDPEKLEAQLDRYHKRIMEESHLLMDRAMERNLLRKKR